MLKSCIMWSHTHNKIFRQVLFFALMFMGIIVRIWEFGIIPGDINQDEAFAGFEAYSLLNNGVDSSGYAFPIYFNSWGSGMNALEIYLMIPFIFLFGLNTFSIRMPQVIIACLTLWIIFLLTKKIFQSDLCFIALFLTAISPWHIMFSRWGLESNLAPAFLIFGLFFFVLGTEKSVFYILSSLFYGLSLYCYATIWVIVPLILFLQTLYSIKYKKIKLNRETAFAVLLLFILALPLIVFLLINQGILPELRTPFLSIPKLTVMRSNELSLQRIKENFLNICSIIFHQSDGYIVNATTYFGIVYHITLPFFLIGIITLLCDIVNSVKKKIFNPGLFILINFASAFLLGLLLQANITKINSLFLPMIIITAYGLYKIYLHFKKVSIILFAIYQFLFICFSIYYFTDYKQDISKYFYYGSKDMIIEAQKYNRKVYVTRKLPYPVVLFYSRENVVSYIDTVQYNNYPNAFLDVDTFTDYSFNIDPENLDKDALYLLDDNSYNPEILIKAGYSIIHSDGIYYLALRN